MKNICFITPSLHQGGLENAVTVLVNELARRGHHLTVLCAYKQEIFYTLEASVKVLEPSYHRSDYKKWYYYLKTLSFFKGCIKKIKPDVVISYGDYLNFISIASAQALNVPVYISDRASPGLQFPFPVNQLRKFYYPKAKGILAQTERARQQKEKMLNGHGNIRVIPNVLREIKAYPEIRKENIILCVARHYEVKGIDRLIEAFNLIGRTDWKIIVAGSFGPETPKLRDRIRSLHLDDRIELTGSVKDIDRLYARAKIFVLPSRSEGYPNALIEAMAHGLPCISFDINAGPADIIEHNVNGILVEDGNIDQMAQEIVKLMDDAGERKKLGNRAKEIKSRLTQKNIVDKIYDFVFPL